MNNITEMAVFSIPIKMEVAREEKLPDGVLMRTGFKQRGCKGGGDLISPIEEPRVV